MTNPAQELPPPNPAHLGSLLWFARTHAVGPDAQEIAPGVMLAEARAAAFHASVVQGGASTPEIEAGRLSRDRRGVAPTEPEAPYQTSADAEPYQPANPAPEATPAEEPKTTLVQYQPDTELARLHAAYETAKSAETAAKSAAKDASDALKNAIVAEYGAEGQKHFTLEGPAGQRRTLGYVESWKFNVKGLKANNPLVYVQYAYQQGSWTLR
jgi:hypothetical protein